MNSYRPERILLANDEKQACGEEMRGCHVHSTSFLPSAADVAFSLKSSTNHGCRSVFGGAQGQFCELRDGGLLRLDDDGGAKGPH